MRRMLNTLFITTEDAYLALDGENIVANRGEEVLGRFPLHTLSGVFSFSYAGASPALMGKCAEYGINLAFFTPRGRFLARVCGETHGNVLLRKAQYRISDDIQASTRLARGFILGKVYNARWSIERTKRDYAMRVDAERLVGASGELKSLLPVIAGETSMDTLRGLEGSAAKVYFDVFDQMILGNKDAFKFDNRNRRPPTDNVNALLSFTYAILGNECASALEGVGLDSYVGFMHRDRPGRASLAFDLMEELRPCSADRFVLTLINNRVLNGGDFIADSNGAVRLTDDARKTFFKSWRERQQQQITHPYLKENIPWGLVPFVQALLLARYLRGDLDEYPPFLWK